MSKEKQVCPLCGFVMIKHFFKWNCTNSLCAFSHDIYALSDEEITAVQDGNEVEEVLNEYV